MAIKNKTKQNNSVGKNMEKLEHLHSVGEKRKIVQSLWEKGMEFPQNI